MASVTARAGDLHPDPLLSRLSLLELEDVQKRMVYRQYKAGEVIWRTHGPLRFSGYVLSGEIELAYRVNGIPVRTTRLYTGDPLPPDALQNRRSHAVVIARAVTDVHLGILPEREQTQTVVKDYRPKRMSWLWPVLLVLLIVILAREDIIRITSGLFYLASSRDPQSMSQLEVAREVDKDAAFAYNEEGYRWFQQNNLPVAAQAFHQAVAQDPASAPALNNLAVLYYTQGDVLQAARYLQQAVAQNPDNATARYNLGMIQMQLQDTAGAIREFREAGFIDPNAAEPLLQQAYLYQQAGDYVHAEQRARSAIQVSPALVPAHLMLGITLYQQGREAEALTPITETLVLEPGNRVAAFYQALILGHQKQYDAALPILYRLYTSSTDPTETMRILAEMDALYRFKSDPAAGP